MDNNIHELLFEQSKNNRFEDLLIQCLDLLFKRIDTIFFKDKHANCPSKFQDNRSSALYFENINKLLEDSTNVKIITVIKKNMINIKSISQLEKLFQASINQVMKHFSDIYSIYEFITVCCIELKCTKILFYYLNLSHNLLPCFVIGDLLLAKRNMVDKWNTEKVLISSMAKVSKEMFQDYNSKILSKKTEEMYISWTICLDNLIEYVKTRLIVISYSQRKVSEDVLCLINFVKELFQSMSRSNLPFHYQILLIINCYDSLCIDNALNNDKIPNLFEDLLSSKVDVLSEAIEDNSLNGSINIIIRKFLKSGMYNTIIDLITILNGLSTLLINIIHQGMKELNSPETDLNLDIHNFCINPIKSYTLNTKFIKKKIVVMELHYLKAHLCIFNQFILERISFYNHLIYNSNRITFDQRYQKVLTSYLFLTIGIIHSFSKIELDEHLITIVDSLFGSQCFILENMLEEKWSYDSAFLKNMDSYRSSLLEYTTKQLFFFGSKDKRFEALCKSCIDKVLKILSLFLEIQNEHQKFKSKENFEITHKINIKFKTSICEVVLRTIQYMNGILDELFVKMENNIDYILNTKYVEGNSNLDEVILNFLISISENLIRLSSRLKSIKKYQDSSKLLSLALKCLINTLSVPWIATEESICEIEKNMEKLKIIQEGPEVDTSQYLYSTPIRKYNHTEQGNTLLNNDILCLTNNVNNTCARFLRNENVEYDNEINTTENLKEIKPITYFLPNTSVQLGNTVTPFTRRLKNKGLSRLQSQTIKRIQTSALAHISKSKSRYGKNEDIEMLRIDQKMKEECELDFPTHILLFFIALEQLISSTQLQFSQEPSQDSLNNILTLIEESLSAFFTLIDHRSYSFIFRNKLNELFPFISNLDIIFNLTKGDEFETNSGNQLINDHFFNLFSSIVTRFAKIKMILINEFTVSETILYRYPIIKNRRNTMLRILWLYLELNYYINCREVSIKCNQVFKKGVLSGFCTNIINIYKIINEFIDKRSTKHLITSSKTNLELYFNFKIKFINYYLWLIKIIFNIQTENHDLIDLKASYINEINKILDELTQFMGKVNSYLYLLRINIYKIHLLFFEDNTLSTISTSNPSKDKHDKIYMFIEESLDLLYKHMKINEIYGQNFHKLLTFEYWKNRGKKNKILDHHLNITKTKKDANKVILNELDDVPVPISNKLKNPSTQIKNELCTLECDSYKEKGKHSIKNSVRFAENESFDNIHRVNMDILREIGSNELEMIFYSTYEMLEIINLQDIDLNLLKKLIGAILYLFSSCWIFIIELGTDNFVDKEGLSKKINCSLNELISNLELSWIKIEHREMLVFNIGLFISNILHHLTQTVQKDVCDSNEFISGWFIVTNNYLDGLLYSIESKYLLSSDFLDEKLSIPLPIVEILFNLIVLKVEHVNELHESFQYLEIINKIGVDEIIKDNQYNMGLFIRMLNKLSTLFMNANKPDISLFYSLEANKYIQLLMFWLDSCNVVTIYSDCNLFSTCITHNFQLYFVNLILESLFQLGEFWWRLGVIERSQSVYNKLVSIYRKWAIPYKKLLLFYFYQLPILLNHLFSRSDSQYNIIYSVDNLYLIKQILYEENVHIENSSHIIFFKEILEHIRVISDSKQQSYFEEMVVLMILLIILAYFTLNNMLSVIKDYILGNFSFIIQNDESNLSKNNNSKITQSLRKIINKLLKHELNSSSLISELFSLNPSEYLDNHHFIFFFNNTINYVLLFISSRYIEVIGDYFINKKSKEAKNTIMLLENEFDIIKKLESIVKKNSIEFTIKEICSVVVLIKQLLFMELTPAEMYLTSTGHNNNLNRLDDNLFSANHSFGKYKLNLINQLSENSSNKNRLQLFKQILIFISVIFNHMVLNVKMNYYLLNQISTSIILDIVLLMKVLCYPDESWNNLFCCFINSLTQISIFSEYSFSIIHSIRKIQKEFEHYKIRDKRSAVCPINNSQSSLLKFCLENKTDDLSEWGWGEYISNKDMGDSISIAFIRFSTFFANSTFKSSNDSKYSLLQITKDCSFQNIYKANSDGKKFTFSSSKLTLLYFIENNKINQLLEEFDAIQHLNTESIVKIDTNTNSSDQVRKWWNRRISIETTLNNWLVKFSNLILKGWMAKLLYGRRKYLNTKQNIKQVSDFVKNYLNNIAPSMIDIILFSLSNNVPQVLDLLNSNNILNIDVADICNNFKKIKLHLIKNKVEHFPIVVFLDKILVCLPIESLHDLKYQPITRGIGGRLCKINTDYLLDKPQCKDSGSCLLAEFCNLYYCINPTGDLEETEKIIVSFIKQKFGSKCSGISNSIPQATDIMNNISIHQSNLYLFCGHQAGEKFMQGEAFERGVVAETFEDEYRFHVPPSLLIGCSSSKIRSYGSNNIFFTPLHYLIGGSPFVLGALWDVTDQDIDRFTMSIFDHWVGSKLSLIESITLAKQECKLPLLNGSACVCFGFPI